MNMRIGRVVMIGSDPVQPPPEILLDPRRTWSDAEAYDRQVTKLVAMFAENFEQYMPHIDDDVKAAAIR